MPIYGPLITYKNIEEAEELIGQEVVISNSLLMISEHPDAERKLLLTDIKKTSDHPFKVQRDKYLWSFQFCRKII